MAIKFPSALDAMLTDLAGSKPIKMDAVVVNMVVNVGADKSRSKDRHNKDARRIYMREYMRRDRLAKKIK